METKIKALHFTATEQLQAFIEKKCAKLERVHEFIQKVEVTLKVVKPETALNKQASIDVTIPNGEFFAEKTCDTFEEAVDGCLDALRKTRKNCVRSKKQAQIFCSERKLKYLCTRSSVQAEGRVL